MRLDDANYRSIRGWCLGNQAPMKIRRALRERGLDCECNYRKPFLHSLVVIEYHWDGPVASNTPGECIKLSKQRRMCPIGGCVECAADQRVEGVAGAFGQHSYGRLYGGFYSYNPQHIKRMGRWEHVHVLGIVSLFGDIAIHEHGFRSDVVRIDHLWVLRSENVRFAHGKLQSFLEDTYQCGVTMLKSGAADSFVDWLQKENIEEIVRLGVEI